jgi:hypothetical protein
VWDREAKRPTPPTALPVTVRFARPVRDVEVWRPSRSGAPVLRRASARTLPLSLEGDVVLVSLR